MSYFPQIVILVALGACAAAAYENYDYQPPNGYGGAYDRTDEKRDFYAPPHYAYEYKVHDPHTGDIKSQGEERKGDVVKGYYTLRDADGTLREVHYSADKHRGFHAEVKRTGHGHHPHYGHQGTYSY
ncbi:hypothetical protein GE061_012554 [Apolygus lucorum]|uniref:Cuticle protein 19 n=1 Tax=Apolygus lucorum TaxID=248454 RepID=A0A6A4JAT8_APOLU|nr:hypothetical protein GE061_012554 [Apolygus lucorum]